MAMSKCAKCDSLMFEEQEQEPHGSNFKLLFVQCAMCGTVVGVMEYQNIGALIQKQNKAIKNIAAHMNLPVDL